MSESPLLYSVPVAAEKIGVGVTKTYELIKDGAIQTVQIGRRRLVVGKSLDEMIERLAAEQAAEVAA